MSVPMRIGHGVWRPTATMAALTRCNIWHSNSQWHQHARLNASHYIQASDCHLQPVRSSSQANALATENSGSTSQQHAKGLYLYNTMSRSRRLFTPRQDVGNRVSMYVCGVTVYDLSHIGHARVYVSFDVLYRLLMSLGYDVQYVRNFTDIDDKIIARAAQTGQDPMALSAQFIEEFHKDLALLECKPPTLEPKATEHVADMVDIILRIMENGSAYEVGGDVFFDIQSINGYGRLSGQKLDASLAGGSERVSVDERKKHPADFVLWKSAKPGEPTWDSPWGPGRPGWHLECSAMIRKLMGPVIDIHGGGSDLVFPHHENEIAQCQAAACNCSDKDHLKDGRDFVRYWMHNGFVKVEAEKMSKSLGNFFTIREIVQAYHPMALRWWLVGTQYRQPVNYTERSLQEASDRVYYVFETIVTTEAALHDAGEALPSKDFWPAAAAEAFHAVEDALLDDLNTPLAIAALSEPLKTMNELLSTKKGRKDKHRIDKLKGHLALLGRTLDVLGLPVQAPQAILQGIRERALLRANLSEDAIQSAIIERAEARKSKNFELADRLREDFLSLGITFQDSPDGTTWRPVAPKGSLP